MPNQESRDHVREVSQCGTLFRRQKLSTHLVDFLITLIASLQPSGSMAPSAIEALDPIRSLQFTLLNRTLPLSLRYRALFALKHHACAQPPTANSVPAIHAIAAAFSSSSALLKHELAYCLGQSQNAVAAPYLRDVLMDFDEDPMCRHEAAEALGALGDEGSLKMLRERRDDAREKTVVRQTCELAVGRIEWAESEAGRAERLKKRFVATIRYRITTSTHAVNSRLF